MLSKFSKEFSSKWGKWNLNTCNLAPVSIVSGTVFLAFHITTFLFIFLEVGKILFVEHLVGEKRRERLHIGECRGTRKLVIPLFFFNESDIIESSE
jgi:hypothetical protein